MRWMTGAQASFLFFFFFIMMFTASFPHVIIAQSKLCQTFVKKTFYESHLHKNCLLKFKLKRMEITSLKCTHLILNQHIFSMALSFLWRRKHKWNHRKTENYYGILHFTISFNKCLSHTYRNSMVYTHQNKLLI